MLSCATIVKYELENPPLVDLHDANSITVIPFEWNFSNEYNYLAGDVTRIIINNIKKAKIYNFINPYFLQNISKSDYWEYVDVYITGSIIDINSEDAFEIKGDETEIYTTRTVTVDIEYKYIRAIDNKVLAVFHRTGKSSNTFNDSKRAEKWWVNILLDIFIPKGPKIESLARSAVGNISANMRQEIVTYTTIEKKQIIRGTNKDKRFKEAEKLVTQKEYFFALIKYKEIYEETGNYAAGFNIALLLQANGQYNEALELLEKMDERIKKSGITSPPFIRNEIENLKKIIEGLKIVEEYKN